MGEGTALPVAVLCSVPHAQNQNRLIVDCFIDDDLRPHGDKFASTRNATASTALGKKASGYRRRAIALDQCVGRRSDSVREYLRQFARGRQRRFAAKEPAQSPGNWRWHVEVAGGDLEQPRPDFGMRDCSGIGPRFGNRRRQGRQFRFIIKVRQRPCCIGHSAILHPATAFLQPRHEQECRPIPPAGLPRPHPPASASAVSAPAQPARSSLRCAGRCRQRSVRRRNPRADSPEHSRS